MYQVSVKEYIAQNVRKPFYSEVYTTPSAPSVSGAELIATRSFNNQKVAMIFMHMMIISLPSAVQPNNYSFTDQFNRVLFNVPANSTLIGPLPFPYFFMSDTITVKTQNPAGNSLSFSLVYQYIQELAGD